MTKEFLIQMDTHRPISTTRLAKAIARVLELAMDTDIEGAEALNRTDIGQVSVLPRRT